MDNLTKQSFAVVNKRLENLEDACLSKDVIERDTRVDMLIQELQEYVTLSREEITLIRKRQSYYDKLIFIGLGILMVVQLTGAGTILSQLIKG